jgi:hypothetical protein
LVPLVTLEPVAALPVAGCAVFAGRSAALVPLVTRLSVPDDVCAATGAANTAAIAKAITVFRFIQSP